TASACHNSIPPASSPRSPGPSWPSSHSDSSWAPAAPIDPKRRRTRDRSDPLKEVETFKLRNRAFWGQWVPLPLRLIIGFGFMAHGWAKLSRGPSGFAKLLVQIGAPLPEATAWVSTFIELLGGLAIEAWV